MLPVVVCVGLGPAGPELITEQTRRELDGDSPVWLRTRVHPAATDIDAAGAFDDVYESAETFGEVYATIVDRLVREATEHGRIVYAVPGSPVVAEHTVELLGDDERVEVQVLASMSFLELSWTALGIDPMAESVTIVDALQLVEHAASRRGPLLITQVHSATVLEDVILVLDDLDPGTVTVLQGLGTSDQVVIEVEWSELREAFAPDHLTTLWVPKLAEPIGAAFQRFEVLVHRLRQDCPWDREQTHGSLRPHLLEETYEVLEALDAVEAASDDDLLSAYVDLEEELGDLLFQVFIHTELAGEHGAFTLADVATGVHDKLHDRHPHVFGDADASTTIGNWEQSKQQEKGRDSALDGIPVALPALVEALKTQRRAASVGFSGPDLEWAFADVDEELAEVREDPSEHEVGDLLFAAVQVARMLEVDAEQALRGATDRFASRFRHVEFLAKTDDLDLAQQPQEALHKLWQQAKIAEKGPTFGDG